MIYDFVDKIGNFRVENSNVISPEPKTEIEDYDKLLIEKVQYGEMTPEEAADDLLEFAKGKFYNQDIEKGRNIWISDVSARFFYSGRIYEGWK